MIPRKEDIALFRQHLPAILAALVPGENGCLLFAGNKTGTYAQTTIGGKTYRLNRVILAATIGQPLGMLHACHSCDNRECCNPAHLFPGTKTQNHEDAVRKGRQTLGVAGVQKWRGEAHGRAKLSESDVRAIRADSVSTLAELVAKYGTSKAHIASIRHRRRWKHLN